MQSKLQVERPKTMLIFNLWVVIGMRLQRLLTPTDTLNLKTNNDIFLVLCRREKVRRKRAKAAKETVGKVEVASESSNQQKPDIVELAKGLPTNWQVCFIGPFVLLYLNRESPVLY